VGSLDQPFNPLSVVLGAEASFAARAIDANRAQLTEVLTAAAAHRGTSFVEIFQDCPIFNDGAFDVIRRGGDDAKQRLIPLRHGEPIRFGIGRRVRRGAYRRRLRPAGRADRRGRRGRRGGARRAPRRPELRVRTVPLSDQDLSHTVTGIFRNIDRPTYDDGGPPADPRRQGQPAGRLDTLLRGKDTWTVAAE